MRDGVGPLLAKGPDFLLYMIADHIVDGYFPVLDRLADEIDELQDRVVAAPSDWTLQRLFVLKRELLAIRRATSPAREVLNQLTNRDIAVIAPSPHHLLPRRLRPPHPGHRRARQLPRAGRQARSTSTCRRSTTTCRVIMKRLTGVTVILAGIGAGRRHLRDERGRRGARPATKRPASGWSPAFIVRRRDRGRDRAPADRLDLSGAVLGAGDRLRLRVGGGRVGRAGRERHRDDLEHGRRALRPLGGLEPERVLASATAGRRSRSTWARGGGPR